jgi:hypothetical protein
MSNYESHAQREFRAAGWLNEDGTFKDDMQKLICEHVLELLAVFDGAGHSGFSAPYAINLFGKLAKFEPVAPLTGEDWEWNETSPGVFQNNRCGHVFKQADRFEGQAYDLDAVVFEEPSGARFTGFHSRRVVQFPYAPRSVVVQIPEDATDEQREMLAAQAWGPAA